MGEVLLNNCVSTNNFMSNPSTSPNEQFHESAPINEHEHKNDRMELDIDKVESLTTKVRNNSESELEAENIPVPAPGITEPEDDDDDEHRLHIVLNSNPSKILRPNKGTPADGLSDIEEEDDDGDILEYGESSEREVSYNNNNIPITPEADEVDPEDLETPVEKRSKKAFSNEQLYTSPGSGIGNTYANFFGASGYDLGSFSRQFPTTAEQARFLGIPGFPEQLLKSSVTKHHHRERQHHQNQHPRSIISSSSANNNVEQQQRFSRETSISPSSSPIVENNNNHVHAMKGLQQQQPKISRHSNNNNNKQQTVAASILNELAGYNNNNNESSHHGSRRRNHHGQLLPEQAALFGAAFGIGNKSAGGGGHGSPSDGNIPSPGVSLGSSGSGSGSLNQLSRSIGNALLNLASLGSGPLPGNRSTNSPPQGSQQSTNPNPNMSTAATPLNLTNNNNPLGAISHSLGFGSYLSQLQHHQNQSSSSTTNLLSGNGNLFGSSNPSSNNSNLPQLVLASGNIIQGIQGAQLLIPSPQGIMTQTILTIPITQPVSPSSLLTPSSSPLSSGHHSKQQHHGKSGSSDRMHKTHGQGHRSPNGTSKSPNPEYHGHGHGHPLLNLSSHFNESQGHGQGHGQTNNQQQQGNYLSGMSGKHSTDSRLTLSNGGTARPNTNTITTTSSSNNNNNSENRKLSLDDRDTSNRDSPFLHVHHHHPHLQQSQSQHQNNLNNSGLISGSSHLGGHHNQQNHRHHLSGQNLSGKMSPCSSILEEEDDMSCGDEFLQQDSDNDDDPMTEGINLDEIKDFAKAFKLRRLSLGLTQTQVGQALSVTEGPAYSQSAICSALAWQLAATTSNRSENDSFSIPPQQAMFEKLDITPKSAQKIKPVLEKWMREAEDRYRNGHSNLNEFVGLEPSKKRKRRTSFTPQALELLNTHFERNTHPSGAEITTLAHQLGYEREVIRIWFCNKRQALKNTVRMMSKGSSGGGSGEGGGSSPI